MEIATSRFGIVEVEEDRVLFFPKGLLGFPGPRRFALLNGGEGNYFFWLQCADDPTLAFVVADPATFVPQYAMPLRQETAADLNLPDEGDVSGMTQVLVICNRVGDWLTGNLLGPVLVNVENRRAVQVVLTEKKWSTRQPLLKLGVERPLAKSA